MDKLEMIMETLKIEKEYSERNVKEAIKTLRGILDRIERGIEEGNPSSEQGLQGNEWRLYTELANLEMKTKFLNQLENVTEQE